MTMKKNIYIVDASNYIFRSYYAIRHMKNSKDIATNAIYGFIRSLQKIQKDFSPEYMAVVFDGPKNKASRTAIYADYKGNREKAPDDLYPQIQFAQNYCKSFGLPIIEIEGHEADDGIGAVARFANDQGLHAVLCSSDKDFCQLVDNNTTIVHTHKNNSVIDENSVMTKYGIKPSQFIDYLAIVGDSSDNIPGIKGFGPKTATTLLQEYGSLENILNNTSSMKNKKRAQKIEEEKESALLSYKLATIHTGLKIPKELSFYKEVETPLEEKKEFLEEMEFKSMLGELDSKENYKEMKLATPSGTYILINDLSSLKGVIKSLEKEPSLCILAQKNDPNDKFSNICAIAIGARKGVCYYIPFNGDLSKEDISREICTLTNSNIAFYGHDIKKDIHLLEKIGIDIAKIDFDTMIASYIVDSSHTKHQLEQTIERQFYQKIPLFKEVLPKQKKACFQDVSPNDAKNYCCTKLDFIMALKELFATKIKEKGFSSLFYDLELPLLLVLATMEKSGIYLDSQYLSFYQKELHAKLNLLKEKIYSHCSSKFNINSPKQLSEILFTELDLPKIKGSSTSAQVLEQLSSSHPIIDIILEYRTLEKLRSTYVDALPKEIDPQTNRIHCTFNQAAAVTGRLSSSNPNLQNIPVRSQEGKKVRKAFVPEKDGWVYLSLDYSQIELRILAHLSKEEKLIEAFNNNKDIHKETAALVFDVPIEQVTADMRYQAKAVNFGILYGQKAFGLAKELQIDVKSAKKFIDIYFEKYSKIKAYIESSIEMAKKEKKSITILGRERLLPDIDSKNFIVKAANERFAVNAPIQGTQADIIKLAMLEVQKQLLNNNLNSFLILQIHDELIFECPEEEVEVCQKIAKKAMEEAFVLSVPIKVDVSIGKNWSEC